MVNDDNTNLDEFISQLTKHQAQLLGFITASTGDLSRSQDILQNTNLALWSKARDYDPGRPFLPWALTFARFEVLAFVRDTKRDRHSYSSNLVELMMDTVTEMIDELPARQVALRHCLQTLTTDHRELLALRYANQIPLARIAEQRSTSVAAVKCVLVRIRKKLARCIRHRLALDA